MIDYKPTPHKEKFPAGSLVKICERAFLEEFQREWRSHNKLQDEQLDFAGNVAPVKAVGFHHGGDPLYELENVPGIWHECCFVYDS